MTPADLKALGGELASSTRDYVRVYVAKELEAFGARLTGFGEQLRAFEQKVALLKDGRDGLPGLPGPAGAPGAAGTHGRDGVDGLGFEDLSVDYDGERMLTVTFRRGELARSFPIVVPLVLYRDVFDLERAYDVGDAVTWGGHLWIAKAPSIGIKPSLNGQPAPEWRLAVKGGRDGKEGKAGPPGRDAR